MGDSGEGLVDAEARIQERIEELQRERAQARRPRTENPEQLRQLESLKLARTQFVSQLEAATQPARKAQLTGAIADIDRRIEEIEKKLHS
jgi:hypothetical protein